MREEEKTLDGFQNIPQTDLPSDLKQRLHLAIVAEGKAIREEKAALASVKKRKKTYRALATLAACFAVGFLSLSMYNTMDGTSEQSKFLESATAGTGSVAENSMAKASEAEESETDQALYGIAAVIDENAGATRYTPQERAAASAEAIEACPPESRQLETSRSLTDEIPTNGLDSTTTGAALMSVPEEEDGLLLCSAPLTTEDPNYELFTEYLKTDQFTIVSVEAAADSTSLLYTIQTEVILENGTVVQETMEYIVKEGVVYECEPGN